MADQKKLVFEYIESLLNDSDTETEQAVDDDKVIETTAHLLDDMPKTSMSESSPEGESEKTASETVVTENIPADDSRDVVAETVDEQSYPEPEPLPEPEIESGSEFEISDELDLEAETVESNLVESELTEPETVVESSSLDLPDELPVELPVEFTDTDEVLSVEEPADSDMAEETIADSSLDMADMDMAAAMAEEAAMEAARDAENVESSVSAEDIAIAEQMLAQSDEMGVEKDGDDAANEQMAEVESRAESTETMEDGVDIDSELSVTQPEPDTDSTMNETSTVNSSLQAAAIARLPERVINCVLLDMHGLKLAVPFDRIEGALNFETLSLSLNEVPEGVLGEFGSPNERTMVVDTARWLIPERYQPEHAQYKEVVILQGRQWGMACDGLVKSLQVPADQINWNHDLARRPWLLGTYMAERCALIDIPALIDIFNAGLE